MAVFKTPQLPDDLDPGTLTDGMAPLYDVATQRWVPGVPDSGTSGTAGVPIFGSQAEAVAWEAENPGRVALWFDSGTEPEPGDVEVTATGPTWTDDTVNGGGTWTTPTETGITYSPASGTATPGQSVTVTATAKPGYVLQGTSSWQHTFPTATVATAVEFMGFHDVAAVSNNGTIAGAVATAPAERTVVALILARTINGTPTAVTIAGVTATLSASGALGSAGGDSDAAYPNTFLARAVVPAASSGDIVITMSGATYGFVAGVWEAPAGATVGSAADYKAAGTTTSLTIPSTSNGQEVIALAGGRSSLPSGTTAAWTGLTEIDEYVPSSAVAQHIVTAAQGLAPGASTPLGATFSAASDASNKYGLIAVAITPGA